MLVALLLADQTGSPETDDDAAQNVNTQVKESAINRPRRARSISRYGGLAEPPSDDSVFYVTDDDFGIFASVSHTAVLGQSVDRDAICQSVMQALSYR